MGACDEHVMLHLAGEIILRCVLAVVFMRWEWLVKLRYLRKNPTLAAFSSRRSPFKPWPAAFCVDQCGWFWFLDGGLEIWLRRGPHAVGGICTTVRLTCGGSDMSISAQPQIPSQLYCTWKLPSCVCEGFLRKASVCFFLAKTFSYSCYWIYYKMTWFSAWF